MAGAPGRPTPAAPAGPPRCCARTRPARPDPSPPPRPVLPGGSLVTVEPGGQIELASPPLGSRRAGRHHRRRRRRCCTASPPHGLAVEAGRRAPERPAAPHARPAALPRDGAVVRPHRPARAQRDVLHRRRAGLRRRGGARPPSPPAGPPCTRSARCCSRRSRTRRALHGRRTGWKSPALGAVDARRPAAHRAAAARPRRPGRGLGPARARRTGAVRAGERTAGWCPRGVTFADWVGGGRAAPPTDLRRPRVPRLHAVPAGPPARPPGGALRRHAARPAVGAAARPCSRRCCPTPADRRRAQRLRARRAGRWVSAARHGLADRVLARAAVPVFELAPPAYPRSAPPRGSSTS